MDGDLRTEYDFTNAVKNPHVPILADSETQRALLWKKYVAKKKSFAKAQMTLSEYRRNDEPAYQQWLESFAGETLAETSFAKYEYKRYTENIIMFDRLCRMEKVSQPEMAYRIQQICITENTFFWGVVRKLLDEAEQKLEQQFRERINEYLRSREDSAKKAKRVAETFEQMQAKPFTPPPRKAPVVTESDSAEIKKLYRTLCLRHHPDKTGYYDETLWLEIQNAYELGNVRKLKELMDRPVVNPDVQHGALSCEEILAMTKAVEQEFKPVRAALKRAKRSIAWEFRKWPESKKEMAKVLLQRRSENENIGIKQLVAEKQQQVRTLLAADKRHKQVKITVSRVPGKKILFDILLEYGVHSKTIPLRVSSQATPEQVAEKCVISALGALKSPCRVDFTLPDDLIGELRKVEPGYVCGDDLTNALSRHIVELRTKPLSRKTEAENNMNN